MRRSSAAPADLGERQRQSFATDTPRQMAFRDQFQGNNLSEGIAQGLRDPKAIYDLSRQATADYERENAPKPNLLERAGRVAMDVARRAGSEIADIPISPYQTPDRRAEAKPRSIGDTARNLADSPVGRALTADIPYRDKIVEAGVRGLASTPLTAGPLGGAGGQETQAGEAGGRATAEVFVPRQVWEVALEFVPGIGSVPDLQRAVKANAPEAIAAVRRALRDPRVADALAAARREIRPPKGALAPSERGALTPSQGDEPIEALSEDVRPLADDAQAAEPLTRAESVPTAQRQEPPAQRVPDEAAPSVPSPSPVASGGGSAGGPPGGPKWADGTPARITPKRGKETLFTEDDAALGILVSKIERGNWTETPGARTGARSIVNMLMRGEMPSEKQMAMLMRALASDVSPPKPKIRPKGKTPRAKAAAIAEGGAPPPRKPRVVVGDEPPVEPPTARDYAEPEPDRVLAGDQGAQQTLDVGAVRLADGMRNRTLADIADKPNVQQRFANFFRGVIGAPKFVLNNKKDLAAAVIQIPRTLKTAIDIGWGGRNGWRLFPKHKAAWFRMYGRQYKTLWSEEAYQALQAQTAALPHFERLKAAGLAFLERAKITGGDIERTSEAGLSKFTSDIPVLRQSERAYIAPGNAMRYEIASDFITRWEAKNGIPMPDAEIKRLVDHYNAATLRGNTGLLNKAHAETLGSILFSTKGLVSGPQYVAGGIRALADPSIDAAVRAEIAGDVASYIAAGMGVMGLMAVANSETDFAEVDFNTHSPTFGQVKVGPVRWNYWGADQSMVRQILMQLPYHGGTQTIDGVPEDVNRPESAWRYISNKLAPGIPRTAWDSAVNRGRTFEGRDVNSPSGFAMNLLDQTVPIPTETGREAYANAGPIAAVVSVLADLNGLTTSTYDPQPKQSKEEYEAQQYIDKSGYNDVGDEVWKDLREGAAAQYDGPTEYRNAMIAEIVADIEETDDTVPPVVAQAIAEKIVAQDPALTVYDSVTGKIRDTMITTDPKLAEYLVQTGERGAVATLEKQSGN